MNLPPAPRARSRFRQRGRLAVAPILALLAAGRTGLAAQDTLPPHEIFTIESAVLGETRRIAVYTPPGYPGAGDARFPVLLELPAGRGAVLAYEQGPAKGATAVVVERL
mgnify:CR=1 FL=1